MCITLTFGYTECVHQVSHIRPCQGDGSRCGFMVVDRRAFSINGFCRECFMLPDPRVAWPLEYRSEKSMLDWMAERYRSWDIEAETQELRIRAQNLPHLPGHGHNPNFPLSNRIPFGLLPKESVILLVKILDRRLIPDFWLRVIRGENPSPAERESILCLQQVLAVHMALCLLRDVMIGNQWEAGMGQQHMRFIAAEAFDPVAHTLGDDEDCGLCREPLRDVEEQGVLVITHCNHVFHQKCLEESLKVSPNVDCPACKAELRGHNQAPQDIQGPDQISEFLTSFMTPEPQSFPSEQPITEQYLDQLDADVGEAIARVREADGDVRAIEREIEEVQQVELLGRPAGTRVKMTRNAQGVIDCVHLSCMMSYAPGEEIIDAGAMMLLRRRVMMEAIKAWAQTDCKVAVEARNRARQELAIRAEQANWIMTELLIEMTGWLYEHNENNNKLRNLRSH